MERADLCGHSISLFELYPRGETGIGMALPRICKKRSFLTPPHLHSKSERMILATSKCGQGCGTSMLILGRRETQIFKNILQLLASPDPKFGTGTEGEMITAMVQKKAVSSRRSVNVGR